MFCLILFVSKIFYVKDDSRGNVPLNLIVIHKWLESIPKLVIKARTRELLVRVWYILRQATLLIGVGSQFFLLPDIKLNVYQSRLLQDNLMNVPKVYILHIRADMINVRYVCRINKNTDQIVQRLVRWHQRGCPAILAEKSWIFSDILLLCPKHIYFRPLSGNFLP